MQESEKDGRRRETIDSMHLRYEELGERVRWWSEKNTQGVNRKSLVHPRDEKP